MAKKAKKENKTLSAAERRIVRRSRRHFAMSVVLFCLVLLVGGSFLAVLVRMQSNDLLRTALNLIRDIFLSSELGRTVVVFWLLVIPVLLSVILAITIARRNRFKYFKRTFEDTVQIAVEKERQALLESEEKKTHEPRFSMLNEIAAAPAPSEAKAPSVTVSSLSELCDRFRNFAATNLHLYYTTAQIREFVASLAVSHILILQGMSGTGKTSLTYAFGEFTGNPSAIIPVQPMWKERSDLLGYYNEFTKKYNETEMLRKMYEANGSEKIYLTVLDEMNIARVEYYFAEFLSLLEIPNPELRYLDVVSDKWDDDPPGLKDGRIKLPVNMWFIGTINNDDSTFAISDKVYDRAMVVNLETRTPAFSGDEPERVVPITYEEFIRLAENAKRGYEITRRNERRLKELDEFLVEKFQISFGNRIMRQIRSYISVYVACGGEELDALDDILAKKVLRKLVYKDLSMLRGDLEETSKFLETLFGDGRMQSSREFLARAAKG